MLPDAVAIGRGTVTARASSQEVGQLLLCLFKTALFAGQFLLKDMATIAIARLLGIFLHARKA